MHKIVKNWKVFKAFYFLTRRSWVVQRRETHKKEMGQAYDWHVVKNVRNVPFLPRARGSYICCLFFSRVSHYNFTTFESNTIESIGHWCDLSKLEEHCRNLKNLAQIYQPYPWHFATSTRVKCLVKSTALALNGSYTDEELPMNCGSAAVVDVYWWW